MSWQDGPHPARWLADQNTGSASSCTLAHSVIYGSIETFCAIEQVNLSNIRFKDGMGKNCCWWKYLYVVTVNHYLKWCKINDDSTYRIGKNLFTSRSGEVKDSRRSGMSQSWYFGDKIGHAKSVGFRFYSAIDEGRAELVRDISRSFRFLWFILYLIRGRKKYYFGFPGVWPDPGGGGALGYFLGGYVPPGTPNWHRVLKKISPTIDTPF